jgi:hypothetical protein
MPEFPVVPPHEAGAQIRVLATQLYEVLSKPIGKSYASFHTSPNVRMAWDKCSLRQMDLAHAIEGRKVTVMRKAYADYRDAVTLYRNAIHQSASQQLMEKKVTLPLTPTGLSVPEAIERLRSLANNLPTQPDLPSADSRDTALRAIIAVLRTHQIPGSEKLTHHAKEDQNAETQTVSDEAASESKPGHIDIDKVIDALDKPAF